MCADITPACNTALEADGLTNQGGVGFQLSETLRQVRTLALECQLTRDFARLDCHPHTSCLVIASLRHTKVEHTQRLDTHVRAPQRATPPPPSVGSDMNAKCALL